jgi:hypothetical protein
MQSVHEQAYLTPTGTKVNNVWSIPSILSYSSIASGFYSSTRLDFNKVKEKTRGFPHYVTFSDPLPNRYSPQKGYPETVQAM